jgi:hypothetical protein
MAVAGFIPEPGLLGAHKIPFRQSPFRASYHGKTSDTKYSDSPHFMDGNKPFSDVVGSAESLVGRVLYEQGLGKYCDPDFVRATQRELAEAFNMTQEEMDRAAHRILLAETKKSGDSSNDSKEQNRGSTKSKTDRRKLEPSLHLSSDDEDDKFKDTKL